ncbi:MAG: alginate lyase, partial [Glaciecola sp.]
HYLGQLIETNFTLQTNTKQLLPMGDSDGYEFLWHTASAMPEQLAQITWLQKDRFYTHSSYLPTQTEILFGRAGANDPNFNFVEDKMFMLRTNATDHQFINILETHGEYNGTKEFTINAKTAVSALSGELIDDIQVVDFVYDGQQYLLVFARNATTTDTPQTFSYNGQEYSITGQYKIITLGQ